MNDLSREAEKMIIQFFRNKDNDQLKRIVSGHDVRQRIDEETEYEIKERIWHLLTTQHIRWYYLADTIKDMVDHTQDEEEDEPQEEEDDE